MYIVSYHRHLRALFYDRRIKAAWRKCVPLTHCILSTTHIDRTKISPGDLWSGQALNLDRGVFLSNFEIGSDKCESLSAQLAKMLRTQSNLMHVHRQILQSTDVERLAKAPQASHAKDSLKKNMTHIFFWNKLMIRKIVFIQDVSTRTRFYLAIKTIIVYKISFLNEIFVFRTLTFWPLIG